MIRLTLSYILRCKHTHSQTKSWRHCFRQQHIKWTLYTAWNFHARCWYWMQLLREIAAVFVCIQRQCHISIYISFSFFFFYTGEWECAVHVLHMRSCGPYVRAWVCVWAWKKERLHSAPDVLLIHRWQRRWNISCQLGEAGLQKLQFSLRVLQRPSCILICLTFIYKERRGDSVHVCICKV